MGLGLPKPAGPVGRHRGVCQGLVRARTATLRCHRGPRCPGVGCGGWLRTPKEGKAQVSPDSQGGTGWAFPGKMLEPSGVGAQGGGLVRSRGPRSDPNSVLVSAHGQHINPFSSYCMPREGLRTSELGKSSVLKRALGDFPGGPVVRTLPSNIRSCGFNPWLGSEDPTCLVAKKIKT